MLALITACLEFFYKSRVDAKRYKVCRSRLARVSRITGTLLD